MSDVLGWHDGPRAWPNAYRARPRVPLCASALCARWCRRGLAVVRRPSCPTLASLSSASASASDDSLSLWQLGVKDKSSTASLLDHIIESGPPNPYRCHLDHHKHNHGPRGDRRVRKRTTSGPTGWPSARIRRSARHVRLPKLRLENTYEMRCRVLRPMLLHGRFLH